jgi:hypothetical protein
MIDIHSEPLLPLSAAAALVPPARRAKRTHPSTLLRWVLDGIRSSDGARIKLEAIRLGGRWMTTRSALQAFAQRLTPDVDVKPPSPSHRVRNRAEDAVEAELDRRRL